MCQETEGCGFFTLNAEGVCYLKETDGVSEAIDGKVSGPALCPEITEAPTSTPTDTPTSTPTEAPIGDVSCVEIGIDYNVNFNDIASYDLACDVTTAECQWECMTMCQETEGCGFFTLNAEGVCYLKATDGVSEAIDGKVSGPALCPVEECCSMEEGVDYDIGGQDLAAIVVEGETREEMDCACQEACRDFDGCSFVTTSETTCYLKATMGERVYSQAEGDFLSAKNSSLVYCNN